MRGPWNGEQWEHVSESARMAPVDDGDGQASVKSTKEERALTEAAALRTKSEPSSDPITGAELGAGPGAGANAEGARSRITVKH